MATHVAVAQRLLKAGFQAHLVGGAVRDQFLGRQAKDFDLATDATPDQVLALFKNGNRVGRHFPVVTVDGVEVATFRVERAEGRFDVDFTLVKDVREDLARRDFTMNAMAVDMATNKVVDPFRGRMDLELRKVRFVGDADERVKEDPLRMFRAVRFAVQLNFNLAHETFMALKRNAHLAVSVSKERVGMEFTKMMLTNQAARAVRLLEETGLLQFVSKDLVLGRHQAGGQHHGEDVLEHNLLALEAVTKMKAGLDLRLAALFHDVGKVATANHEDFNVVTFHGHEVESERVARRTFRELAMDGETARRAEVLVRHHMFHFEEDTRFSRMTLMFSDVERAGVNVRDLFRLRLADRRANLAKSHKRLVTRDFKRVFKALRKFEREMNKFKLSDVGFSGHTLMEMGFKAGPQFKVMLDAALEAVHDGTVAAEFDAVKAFVAREFVV